MKLRRPREAAARRRSVRWDASPTPHPTPLSTEHCSIPALALSAPSQHLNPPTTTHYYLQRHSSSFSSPHQTLIIHVVTLSSTPVTFYFSIFPSHVCRHRSNMTGCHHQKRKRDKKEAKTYASSKLPPPQQRATLHSATPPI